MKSLFTFGLVIFVTVSTNANAGELYLRCELRDWPVNPIIFQVDLDRSMVNIFVGSSAGRQNQATITAHQIVVPFSMPNTGYVINRLTGDVEFRGAPSGSAWKGTCEKIENKKF
jgi:hypothetical protein